MSEPPYFYSNSSLVVVYIYLLHNMKQTNNIQTTNEKENNNFETKIRRVQAIYGQKSLLLCLPIEFTYYLGIAKGNYVKCRINDNQLIVEKAEI